MMFANWNTNKRLFDSLFIFQNEWHHMEKQMTAYTEDVAFLFFLMVLCASYKTSNSFIVRWPAISRLLGRFADSLVLEWL